jgi:TonB-dependent receptor
MKLNYRAAWLLGAASAALCAAPMASAQTVETTDTGPQQAVTPPSTAETIVVTGRPLADSEAASLAIQRNADSVVTVLSADAIGNLPDQNIAFAVGRLPGVAIERDQGQARYVNLRGTPNYWTTLSFDGLSVVSPEGRATRFDNIPSAISKQVVVTKAITPNMPGDTVAGNVNIVTRSAFDYSGLNINGKVGVGYVTLGGGEELDSSIIASDTFLDGRLGLLASASYYRRNMVTDNWETDPYLPATDAQGNSFAREHENKLYRLTRENQSLAFRADYQINDENTVFWNNTWTNYTDEELRSNYIFRFDQGTGPTGAAYSAAASGNTAFAGTVYGARINSNTNSLESEEDTYLSTFGGEHLLMGWDASWRANYAYTADGSDAPALPTWQSPSTFTDRPTVVYNFADPSDHKIMLYRTAGATGARTRGAQASSIEDFPLTFQQIQRATGGAETQAYTLKADIGRDFEIAGFDVRFDAGLMYTDRTKKNSTRTFTSTRANMVAAGVAVPEITSAGPTAAWNTLFMRKPFLGEVETNYAFRYHNKQAIEALALDMQLRGIGAFNVGNADTTNYWKVGEEIIAGYAMSKVDFDWGNVVFGARVENFKNNGAAYTFIGTPAQHLVETSGDETLVYPSAHINWDINDDMKLRIGLSTSASRPDFDVLRPNYTFSDTDQTVSGGNPNAEPEKQQGIDVYYEWYMQPEGFISAGVFYKNVEGFLFDSSLPVFGSDALNSGGIDRSGYEFNTVDNGGDGYVQGFEIFASQTAQAMVDSFGLPDWLGGFGMRASATWIDSELDLNGRDVKLPGTSDGVYNLQAIYEKYNLSVRLAYQYRTAWIQSLGGNAAGDVYWNDDEEIDLSIRYKLNDSLEWFFDGSNLGNQAAIRYIGNKNYPIERERFGERFMMGVRFNY